MNTDILIIGGGASGLTAAVCARDANPGCRITVAEKLPRPGKKLLATGNGRCNLMNENAASGDYLGDADFIRPALEGYRRDYAAFWDRLGLELKSEEEGRIYPACNQASAVLDVLRLGLRDRNIDLRTECPVTRLGFDRGMFTAVCPEEEIRARRVILATGGKAGKGLGENDSFQTLAGPLGHRVIRPRPALTCLKVPKDCVAGLKGIRLRGRIRLMDGETPLWTETGEVLFQEDGISGIAAMQLSLRLPDAKKPAAELSVVAEGAAEKLLSRRQRFRVRRNEELLTGLVNRMIALSALKRCGIDPAGNVGNLTDRELERLAETLSRWRIPITGTGDFASAQVMIGGLDTRQFDPERLESKSVPGFFACGEALNVTGPCGGYNLEWAWAGGMLAGRKAAEL